MQERTLNRPMIFLLHTVEQRKSFVHADNRSTISETAGQALTCIGGTPPT